MCERDCGNCFFMQDFVCVIIRDTGECPYMNNKKAEIRNYENEEYDRKVE